MAGMIPLAVVLIVLVIVFTIAIIIGNPQSFDLQVFVARIPANITGVYVTGAVTMLVLAVAGWLLWTGIVRMRARQQELRALKAAAGKSTKKAIPPESGKAPEDKNSGGAAGVDREKEATLKRDEAILDADPKRAADSSSKDAGVSRTTAAGDADPSVPGAESAQPSGDRDLGDDDQPATTPEERRRLLAETDDLTRDDK